MFLTFNNLMLALQCFAGMFLLCSTWLSPNKRNFLLLPILIGIFAIFFTMFKNFESTGAIIGLAYCAVYFAFLCIENGQSLEKSNLFTFAVNVSALGSNDIRHIFIALFITLCINIYSGRDIDKKSSYIYFSLNTISLILAFYFCYQNIGGFILNRLIMNRATLTIVCLSSLLRIGIFPTHTFLLKNIEARGMPALVEILNPLLFKLPFMIVQDLTTDIDINIWETAFFFLGALLSLYYTIISFVETELRSYLYYASSAVFTILISSLIFLETELMPGATLFFISSLVSFAGLFVCIEIISNHYGTKNLNGKLGLSWQNPSIANLALFFILVLSNMPLTLSFIGEDIILYELYNHSLILGLFVLIILSLLGLSLYRFYGQLFCGNYDKRVQALPLLRNEKIAMSSLFTFYLIALVYPLFLN